MSFRVALLIALGLPLSFADSAPGPKDADKPQLYLPTTVGDKRVLEVTFKGKSFESIEWVSGVEKKGDMVVVSFAREENGPALYAYGASADGMFRIWSGNLVYDPPYRLLKLPAKEGETWESVSPATDTSPKWTFKFTTAKEEEVTVPAGKFKAILVEVEHELNGLVIRTTYWFAPGLGAIKIVTRSKDEERVQQLKTFSSGKK